MPKIEKLKSGSYRVRFYDNTQKKQLSFTHKDKQTLKRIVADYESGKNRVESKTLTVAEAVENYINSKSNILSPSTIRGYYIIYNNALNEIKNLKVADITEIVLQKWVNSNAKNYSAKSIRNQYGLITATLKQNGLHLNYDTVLLKPKQKKQMLVPNTEQIKKIIEIVKDTNIEIPIMIAVLLGLRRSEICALKWSDYDGERLYIHAAVVPDKNNQHIRKETNKSYAGTRVLDVPDVIKILLDKHKGKGNIVNMLPSSLLREFSKICERNDLPKFTLHSLRHANASFMLLQGIPDKYAMERLGQSTNNMLKTVYQHTFTDEQRKISDMLNRQYSDMF